MEFPSRVDAMAEGGSLGYYRLYPRFRRQGHRFAESGGVWEIFLPLRSHVLYNLSIFLLLQCCCLKSVDEGRVFNRWRGGVVYCPRPPWPTQAADLLAAGVLCPWSLPVTALAAGLPRY